MVDLFGRLGRLKEAVEFIEFMEIEFDLVVWEVLFIVSCYYGNVVLMIYVGEYLFKLNFGNSMVNRLFL